VGYQRKSGSGEEGGVELLGGDKVGAYGWSSVRRVEVSMFVSRIRWGVT
jgi:hypothetical protein